MNTRASSTHTFAQGTGRGWEEWLAFLAANGSPDLTHSQVVDLVKPEIERLDVTENVGWWAQGVAVAYGQHTGQRVPGQGVDGHFHVSASRTLDGDAHAVITRWTEHAAQACTFNDVELDSEPTTSTTPKRHYWRANLADGSKVTVSASASPETARTPLSIEHSRLADGHAGVEPWRTFWKAQLKELADS